MQMPYFCQLWINASSTCIFHILKMIPNKQLYLAFLFGAFEDACRLVIASCFFFSGHLRMLAAWWLYLAFLSMALEDACCLVIASCFSFYGTWRCLQTGDCILFFLSMALEDACCLVIASCFFFLWHLRMLAAWWLHLAFSFYGTWRCLLPD